MTSDDDLPDELREQVDRAVDAVRDDYIAELRELADRNERISDSLRMHDEALAGSLSFAALRLRRVAKRLSDDERGRR